MNKETQLQIRLTDQMKQRLSERADELGFSISQYIRWLVQNDLKKVAKKNMS